MVIIVTDYTGEQIIENILRLMEKKRAAEPKNLVFEYSPHVEENRAYWMRRDQFEDGRHRVFLHPKHEGTIEAWLETL